MFGHGNKGLVVTLYGARKSRELKDDKIIPNKNRIKLRHTVHCTAFNTKFLCR
ncbi:hypothetical protein SOASR029_16320 [Budvicia aquatica]|nr:hypothetical protein SOASR029_16320 [Budvicia aquatica]